MGKIDGNNRIKLLINYDTKKTLLENEDLITNNINTPEEDVNEQGIVKPSAVGVGVGAGIGGLAGAAGLAAPGGMALSVGGAVGVAGAGAAAVGGAILGGAAALALVPLVLWLVDKDTESGKVEKLFNLCKTDARKISKIPRTVSDEVITDMAEKLHDAMNGAGTDEEAVYTVFKSLGSVSDLSALIVEFDSENPKGLLDWLDSDFDQSDEWLQIYRPLKRLVKKDAIWMKDVPPASTPGKTIPGKTIPNKPTPGIKTGTKYLPCTGFPIQYGCKGDLVKQVQSIILMPEKFQTGNFGPLTLKKLRDFVNTNKEVGVNPSDFNDPAAITKSTYDKLTTFEQGMGKPMVGSTPQVGVTPAPKPQISVNPTPKIDTTVSDKITPTPPLPKKKWSPLDIFKPKEKTAINENIEEIKGMFKRIL